ncbi:MAG: hypothetical protein ACLTKE_08895 [Coprococcus sp.]
MGHAHCNVALMSRQPCLAGMVRGENLQNKYQLLVTLAVVVVVRSLMSLLNSKLSFEASKYKWRDCERWWCMRNMRSSLLGEQL